MLKEVWKDVPGYEDYYQASDLGRIKSKDFLIIAKHPKNGVKYSYNKKGKMLKPWIDTHGYCAVSLNSNRYRVHRIIAKTFLDDYSENLCVDHIDKKRDNNNLNNLRMCTRSENNRNFKKTNKIKSGFVGVYEDCSCGRTYWFVSVMKDGKTHHGGSFNNKIEAAKKHDELAKKLHGDFATLNYK